MGTDWHVIEDALYEARSQCGLYNEIPVASLDKINKGIDECRKRDRKRRPAVGIAAVVVMDGRFLLGARRHGKLQGWYGFPGGHLEWGEGSFEEAAIRECEEEAGITPTKLRFVTAMNNVVPEEDHHYVVVFMLVEGFMGKPRNVEPHKCDGWGWYEPDALPEPCLEPIKWLVEQHPEIL
ncbi:hypothetical protein LCGC14_2931310 [marine sediment metagenome]|uniref:Nudix hydrolase domain-containing protein n=1 Tax=marine sediment metagenome TaxID=412755 RepID=A0A0F8Y7T3_9ZZZZ